MAKDDYFHIVYRILSYLYTCLKRGQAVEPEAIGAVTHYYAIEESYWAYIIKNLISEGLITGVSVYQSDDETHVTGLHHAEITPNGIEYLEENSMMKKVVRFLKKVKEITPGI